MQPFTSLPAKIFATFLVLIMLGIGVYAEYGRGKTVQSQADQAAVQQTMQSLAQVCAGEGKVSDAYVFRYTSTSTDAYYQCVRVSPPTDTIKQQYYGIWINQTNQQ